ARVLREASKMANDYGFQREAASLGRLLASVLLDQGLPSVALSQLESVRPYFATARPEDRLWFNIDHGWILAWAMAADAVPVDWSQVEKVWRVALEGATELQDANTLGEVRSNLAWLALMRGEPLQALELAQTLRDDGRREGPFVRLVRGEAALSAGDTQRAQAELLEAVRVAKLEGPSEWGWRAQHALGRVYEAVADLDEAAKSYDRALEALETLGRFNGLISTRGPYFANRHELIDDALTLAVNSGRHERVLEIIEAARTRVYSELNGRARLDAMDAERREQWGQVRGELDEIRSTIHRRKASREALAVSELDAFDRSSAELLRRYRTLLDDAVTRFAPPPQTANVALSETVSSGNSAWLTHRVGDRVLHVVLSEKEIRLGWDSAPEIRATGHLYLLGTDAPERFAELAATRAVSVIPTLHSLEPGRESELRPSSAVFADPVGDLPHARREGEKVGALLGAEVRLGERVRRIGVRDALAQAQVVHFAGHVRNGAPGAWDQHLLLHGEETLSVSDLLTSSVRSRLVVINGCHASEGEAIGRNERVGLAEAMLLAGAQTVVTARGEIDDAVAREFLERFYELGGARSPARAFQSTSAELVASNRARQNDFVLWGRP
ncbi:MAG: CHAT domain-containing protein, partial [Myxococcota bacterium]